MNKNFNEEQLYQKYFNVVYKICFLYIKEQTATYDMVQETFEKMIKYKPKFETEEKAKAWLIVTASNLCKTHLNKWWNKKRVPYEPEMENITEQSFENIGLKEMIDKMEYKYSVLLFLYYYEGYKIREIAEMLKEKESTLKARLVKARKILKLELEALGYEN